MADGIVITPSHNPPEDDGLKYNATPGGPAAAEVTGWIQRAANELLDNAVDSIRRTSFGEAITAPTVHRHDYISGCVDDLPAVVDLAAIPTPACASASTRLAAPASGSGRRSPSATGST